MRFALLSPLLAFIIFPYVLVGPAVGQGVTYRVVGVTAGDVLNVRARPTTRSAVVGTLSPSASGIQLTGPTKRNGSTVWQKIKHRSVAGWVNQRYLGAQRTVASETSGSSAGPQLKTSKRVGADLKKRIAMVIGNGRYSHGISSLTNAPNDGRAIARSLSSLGFEVIELINADLAASQEALKTFTRRAKGAEIALFYFAGHGIQVNGENYFLPTSAKLRQPEDLLTEALSLSDIMAAFAEAKPALSMVILDACRNNPVTDTLKEDVRSRGIDSIKIEKGLAKRSGLPGMMIVYSTDPNNVAADGAGQNSPFTKAMLEKMSEPEVEVRLMFGAVREAVVKDTKGRQTPWMEEAVLGRFFFKPPPKIRTTLFHGKWQAEHWTLLVDAKSVQMLKAFIPGNKPETLSQATCGQVFKRTYTTLKVDRIRQELGNARIAEWAWRLKNTKTLRVMKIVCAYGANLYYFLIGEDTNMLVARFSEQDWLMMEEFDKDLR